MIGKGVGGLVLCYNSVATSSVFISIILFFARKYKIILCLSLNTLFTHLPLSIPFCIFFCLTVKVYFEVARTSVILKKVLKILAFYENNFTLQILFFYLFFSLTRNKTVILYAFKYAAYEQYVESNLPPFAEYFDCIVATSFVS